MVKANATTLAPVLIGPRLRNSKGKNILLMVYIGGLEKMAPKKFFPKDAPDPGGKEAERRFHGQLESSKPEPKRTF
jgi:hypothetical protein